jgi:transposase
VIGKRQFISYLKAKRMKTWNVILGVDVSKRTLDISWAERRLPLQIDNNREGFGKFKKWCKDQEIDLREIFVVLEYTGGYEYRFIQFCQSQSIAYCRVPGLEIKQSMGMVRGKSDRADAFRISRYGQERIKRLEPSKPLDDTVIALKTILSFRKRLVRENAGYQSSVQERKHMYEVDNQDMIVRILKEKMKVNQHYIKQAEERIMELIRSNADMWLNYRIITSIEELVL